MESYEGADFANFNFFCVFHLVCFRDDADDCSDDVDDTLDEAEDVHPHIVRLYRK